MPKNTYNKDKGQGLKTSMDRNADNDRVHSQNGRKILICEVSAESAYY